MFPFSHFTPQVERNVECTMDNLYFLKSWSLRLGIIFKNVLHSIKVIIVSEGFLVGINFSACHLHN